MISTNEEIRIEDLFGTWTLVSMTRTITETGEIVDLNPQGNPPFGFLMYGNDGRMLVLNLTSGRPRPDSLDAITDEQRIEHGQIIPADEVVFELRIVGSVEIDFELVQHVVGNFALNTDSQAAKEKAILHAVVGIAGFESVGARRGMREGPIVHVDAAGPA